MLPPHRGIDEPLSRQVTRYVAFAAACALQLIFTATFIAGSRARSPAPTPDMVMTQILLRPAVSQSAPQSAQALVSSVPLLPAPIPSRVPDLPLLPLPAPSTPLPARAANPDWARAARLAAAGVASAGQLARRRQKASGELEWAEPESGRGADHQASFPWSRQPLTDWLDFDPTTLLITIKVGQRCVVAFRVILPGFGCVLGHIDPDPGRGDLFDAKYRPAPLTLPAPALPLPSAP